MHNVGIRFVELICGTYESRQSDTSPSAAALPRKFSHWVQAEKDGSPTIEAHDQSASLRHATIVFSVFIGRRGAFFVHRERELLSRKGEFVNNRRRE